MEKDDIYVEMFLNRIFVKDGCIIPQRDEKGGVNGLVISSKHSDATAKVCPYCEGIDNILEVKKDDLIIVEDLDKEVSHELTFYGYRCASCFRQWVMFISDKGESISLGLKPAQVN
jgi:hypothetical protein